MMSMDMDAKSCSLRRAPQFGSQWTQHPSLLVWFPWLFNSARDWTQYRDFYSPSTSAPLEIVCIVDELKFLRTLLKQIEDICDDCESKMETVLALQRCKAPLDALWSIINPFAAGFASESDTKRRWTAIKFVQKGQKVAQFKGRLRDAKVDLLLAQQISAV